MEDKVLVGILVGLVIGSSTYIWNSESFTKTQKIGLLCCLIFPPLQWLGILFLLIYNNYRNSNSIEKVAERKNEQEKRDLDNSLSNLNNLKQKGILTEEEYQQKVDKIKAEKTEQDIKKSNEYQQLKSLLDRGIFTKEEFKNKSKLIETPTKEDYITDKQLIKKTSSSNYVSIYKVRVVIGIVLIFSQLLNIIAVIFKLFINKNYNHLMKDITTIFIFLIIGLLIHPKAIEKLKKVL